RSLSPSAGLSHTERRSWNISGELTGLASGNFDITNRSADTAIMSDVNGDGFPDRIAAKKGSFDVWINRRGQGFDAVATPWVAPAIASPPDTAQHDVVPINPIVRWRAPFPGRVTFKAPIQKLAAGGDGVQASIYVNGDFLPIWTKQIAGDDTSVCNPGPGNSCNGTGFTFPAFQAGERV